MIVFRYKELLFRKKAAKSLTNEIEDEGLVGEFGNPFEWLLLCIPGHSHLQTDVNWNELNWRCLFRIQLTELFIDTVC